VNDSKDLKEATRRLIIQKISKLKQGNVLSFPK
jgi:ribonuclease HII